MKTLWVEGIAPHTSQRAAALAMEYSSEPASFVCTDKVSLTVIGIEKVEWQGRANSLDNGNVLDADPNWPTLQQNLICNQLFVQGTRHADEVRTRTTP